MTDHQCHDMPPTPDLKARLDAIIKFLPVFRKEDFVFGAWTPSVNKNGIIQMPFVTLSPSARAFIQVAYEVGWVTQFAWPEWAGTKEAHKFQDDPQALSHAKPEQLAKLLTVCIRQNRFVEGALLKAFTSGLIIRILERAAVLRDELG